MHTSSSPADGKFGTFQPFANFNVPKRVQNIILLYLPIEDILHLVSFNGDDDSIQLHSLLHKSDQNQLYFRFTRDMKRVWTKPQILKLGIKIKHCNSICALLGKIQLEAFKLSTEVTTSRSGLKSSTCDERYLQNIDRTVDGNPNNFWSSNGSPDQDKVDWLLYDLGTVAVINQISVAAFKARFHQNSPIYGFQTCWIEFGFTSEEFHFKTKVFNCLNTDEPQNFTSLEHLENTLPSARYIKLWMQGCHQKQIIDNRWYFAIKEFEVRGIPLECFPDPVPKTLQIIENLKSKTKKWLKLHEKYKEFVADCLRQ